MSDTAQQAEQTIELDQLKMIIENPNVNGFVSFDEQYMIFDTLLASGMNPFGSSVLHYGCGNGEFVRYAYNSLSPAQRDSSKMVDFLGYDPRPEVVQAANSVYDYMENVKFTTESVDQLEDNSYDWIISPHYFIYKDPSSKNDLESTIGDLQELVRISRFGVLITMLKSSIELTDEESEMVFNPDKVEVYKQLVENVSNHISIIDNYSDSEYTIYIHKIEK